MKTSAADPDELAARRPLDRAAAGWRVGARLVLGLTVALACVTASPAQDQRYGPRPGRGAFWRGGGEARAGMRGPDGRGGGFRAAGPRDGFGPRAFPGRSGYEVGPRPGFEAGPYGGPPRLYAPGSGRYGGAPFFGAPPRDPEAGPRFRGAQEARGAFARGQILPPGAGGFVADPRVYHLRRPPAGYGWVTVGPNAYLTQRATGLILDTAPLY